MSQETLHAFLSAVDTALKETAASNEKRAGTIRSNNDGILAIEGLPELKMGEVVEVEGTGVEALVMQVETDIAYAVMMRSSEAVREGLPVTSAGKTLSINASEGLLGRVVDPLGKAMDEAGDIASGELMPLEARAPGVMERKSVHEPVQTGIVSIDSLIPIGRGQRELIIGDRQTGKTTVALDTIINQKDQDMVCVYVSIAQREGRTAQVVEQLKANGAMDYTIVVSAPAAGSAVMQFLAPYAGVAIAEYFMKQGKHVLVVYDDLSKHAVAYREMSLLLRRPPGREAYPGDVFFIHSRLLERAAKVNDELGAGSITALPIIETQAGDVSAYIPTNVISITDGQIFLETDLFNQGVRPAINVGISVSRVGGAAQTKIMKKVSGSAKLDLAQYYELAAFSQFASELDESTKKQLIRGERMVEAMKQKANNPYKLWQEVAVLWAASNGYLDAIPREETRGKIEFLLDQMEQKHAALVKDIMEKKELSDDIKKSLDESVKTILS